MNEKKAETKNSTKTKQKVFPDSFRTFFQAIFISFRLFIQNSLSTYASACAFGFFFSMLPVLLMILIVLIRILHAEQNIIYQLYQFVANFIDESQFNG